MQKIVQFAYYELKFSKMHKIPMQFSITNVRLLWRVGERKFYTVKTNLQKYKNY